MDQRFEPLLGAPDAKQFVAEFRLLQQRYPGTNALLADLVSQVAPSVYDPLYDQDPHGLYGITCAALTERLLPDVERWRPYAQQLWALRKQRRRSPLVSGLSPAPQSGLEEDWSRFKDVYRPDIQSALGIARTFLCSTTSRDFFRARTLMLALRDLALGGHKFNYLAQSWLVAERLGLEQAADALIGPLHLLAVSDQELVAVDEILEQRSAASSKSRAPGVRVQDVAEALIYGSEQQALSALTRLQEARDPDKQSPFDYLLPAAAQTLAAADRNRWLPAVRAFHTAFLCQECCDWFEPRDRTTAMLLAGLVINRAAQACRADPKAPALDATIRVVCPTAPFDVLKSVISHSDPYASATAVYAILGMEEEAKQRLPQALLAQALKNDGDVCWGHDILFVSECWRAYSRAGSPRGDLFPATAGFLLGQVLKRYTLAADYGA